MRGAACYGKSEKKVVFDLEKKQRYLWEALYVQYPV